MPYENQIGRRSKDEKQALPREIKKYQRECWRPGCPGFAWLRDWAGWHWCGRCFWKKYVRGYEEHKWTKIKLTKIYWRAFTSMI